MQLLLRLTASSARWSREKARWQADQRPSLYDRLNATVADMQGIVNKWGQAKQPCKLFNDDALYNKANAP